MTFLHISLLLGSIVVSAPILLHLLGRRQPKPISFPAIRFVRETAVSAQRGWSIKRWLLLALRVLLVLILALAMASPRVPSAQAVSYLAGGLLGVLALLATAAAAVAWGARRPPWVSGTVGLIAIGLWGMTGMFLASAIGKSEPIALGSADGPVSAAIILDTSPSMAYRYHNSTRLEDAKEMARWLMDRFPVPSQIAIVGSDSGTRLNPDRLSAERQLDRVAVEGRATDLIDRIRTAIELLRKSELERREIYVLTDLRDAAWRNADTSEIAKLLAATDANGQPQSKILLQLIDLSVPESDIKNWAITNAKLSQESAVPGGQVTVSAEIQATEGIHEDQLMCELVIEPVDRRLPATRDGKVVVPEGKVVDRQLVQVPEGGSVPIQMAIQGLAEGTNHAVLRLSRPDPLELDNVVYLSIEARTQGWTAVLADDPRDAQLVSLLLDPNAITQGDGGGKSLAPTKKDAPGDEESANVVVPGPSIESLARLPNLDLSRYAHIVLYNPRSVSVDDADRLLGWVSGGGGLLVVLGPAPPSAEEIANSGLGALIPGTIKRQTRRGLDDRSMFLNPIVENHPIWSIFERPVREIPWVNYPVFRHWDLEGLPNDATEIVRMTGSDLPAMVEWVKGQGRIMVMTFPYPEPAATAQSDPWSELFTTSADAWPGFALFVGTTRYLATHNKHPVNYLIDAPAVLDNNVAQYPKVYELFHPNGDIVRVEAADDLLSYPFTRQPGQYRIRGLRPRGPVVRGFSVNIDRAEISLKRVGEGTLTEALGKGSYAIAKEKSEVQSSIGEGRYGRDLSPFLLVLLVMMVMAEQTMSSRFYASNGRGKG
jgi:hypothetical protein